MLLRNIGSFSLLLLGGVVAAAVGLSFPIHFRATSPLILEEAAKGTPTLAQRADDFLNAGRPGPVALFAAVDATLLEDSWRQQRLREILEAHPVYRFSGGPAPYFEQFLAGIRLPETGTVSPVLPLVLPRDHRAQLLGFLNRSSNSTVHALLRTRELSGYRNFLPVFSAAGHPLDAAILVTALLEQSNAWQPAFARQLRTLSAAAAEEPGALADLERIYLAVVTLSTRSNWTQLTSFLEFVPDTATLEKLAAAIHQEEGDFATLYSAVVLSGDAPAMIDYLEKRPEDGWQVIRFALGLGAGALRTMAAFGQPLYEPPAIIRALPLAPIQEFLQGFSENQPRLALVLKVATLFLAGYFFARALVLLLTAFRRPHPTAAQGTSLEQLFYAFSALGVAVLLGALAEPRLLEFAPDPAAELRLNLAQLLPGGDAVTSSQPASHMTDQVTLIVLLMFFIMQLTVFTFSLLKLREIRKQDLPASVKLSLLDNEDLLFDLGLYIGLGGTVGSLILVVMELLEASLMAAYTSTLFGIIFVAILKIFFLRPFRRRLILESTRGAPSAT